MSTPCGPERARDRRRGAQTAAAEKIVDLAAQYRACFATPAGRRVLADLERCYARSTVGRSARLTELRAAQRDVLLRLQDLLEIAGEPPAQALRQLSRVPTTTLTLLEPWSCYERHPEP